jgi:hypothetical protein
MRRYGVRILVAVLTFGLGVVFSFVFGTTVGVFNARETKKSHNWGRRDCPKKLRNQILVPLDIQNIPNAPLRLVDLGPAPNASSPNEHLIRLSVENESNNTITAFVLRGEKVWASSGASVGQLEDVTTVLLRPGGSSVVYLVNDNETAVSMKVSQVQFQDGSVWNNPHEFK